MGIQGLLPFLKEASHQVNVRKYSGYTVAIDTYCWIHRGAFGCAMQLAKGENTDMYVRYCLKYINMLRSMDIKPILVFDGSNLPAKKIVETSRRERRELYSKKGRQFLREGKLSEARDCFTKCVNVTPQMALEVIKAARSLGVDCIVAPYEADAQLAYLAKKGIVQAVITEDSDLVAFGCPRVIYKLDLNGNGLEIEASRLEKVTKMGSRYSAEKFRYMCIAAGCDYLPSLPGIGLGKARKLFQVATNPDLTHVLKRIPLHLKMKLKVPQEYIDGFHQANNTFLYQLAFDPMTRRLVPLHPYSDDIDKESLTYAGAYYSADLALEQALGNVDANTKKTMFNYKPDYNKPYDKKLPRHRLSVWHKHYRPGLNISEDDPVEIQRQQTNGKEVTLKVNQVKQEGQTRKRPRPAEENDLTADDLTSLYGSPNTKRHSADQSLVIPETPESKDKEQGNINSQQRNSFSKKEGSLSPKQETVFGSEERIKKTLSRRNIFAKNRMSSSARQDILRGSEVVTSRFFLRKQEEEVQNKKEEDEKEQDAVAVNPPSILEGAQEEGLQDDTSQANTPFSNDDVHERTCASLSNGSRLSCLDRLQRFQRSISAPLLPSTTSSSLKTSVGENTSSSQELSQVESQSFQRLTTQNKCGAFSWFKTSSSMTRSVKTEGNLKTFKSLNDFRLKKPQTKMEWGESQQSVDKDSTVEDKDESQDEFKERCEFTNLYSIDTDSLSMSQFSSQSDADNNSHRSESQSLHINTEVIDVNSNIDSLLSKPQDDSLDVENETVVLSKRCSSISVSGPDKRLNQKPTLLTHIGQSSKSEMISDDQKQTLNMGDQLHHAVRDNLLHHKESSDRMRNDKSITSSEMEREECVDLTTSDSDENTPPQKDKKRLKMGTNKKMKQSWESTPKLPNMPKVSPGVVTSGPCKAPGLSRRQRSKQPTKSNSTNGSKQQTLFAFMKKNTEKTQPIMPLSPSKQNIMCDVTPEGDSSICTKGILGVQRNIFRL
ncbi:uncharacterized protein [Asterias amurensis]|uniref:uncharacterized protein n=1 Tax=Asterias amurensis TaxID=7602 RepID=UPI003AB73869